MPVSTVPSALLFSLAAVLSLLPPPIASIIAAASGSPGSSRRTAPAGPDGGRPEPAAAALRVAVFAEAGFPSIDVQPIDRTDLARALAGLDVSWMDTGDLAASLARPRFDVVVLPYGSAFPKAAWPAIVAFLRAGGSWVNVGGTPVSVPVVRDGTGWRCEARATSYHRALSITHTFAVPVDRVTRHASRLPGVGAPDIGRLLRLDRSIGLNVRFADTRDYPGEDGTGGQRDARLDPLVTGTAADGAVVCAPVVGIDRLLGPFAGGRWVLATLVGGVGAELIRAMVAHAGEGASSFEIRPTMAGFLPGERPSFQVRLFRPWRGLDAAVTPECGVQIADGRGTAVGGFSIPLTGKGELLTGSGALPATAAASLARGLYRVTASVPMGPVGQGRTTDSGAARVAGTGFLVYEPAMLAGGTPVTAGGAWLGRAGLPFPVAGTTYMASDVHRKFLFEPDAARWDDDFALMRQAGVNLVRTGVWTGWKNLMLDVGAPSEAMLRALDVFLLTARRHDIPVIFTVFAFLPESWGGANPYLDPRAVDAQRALVGALARRYAAADDLIWDLINEPSFSSAAQLWTTRPNGDAFERAAWQQWLAARFGAATPEALDAALSEALGHAAG